MDNVCLHSQCCGTYRQIMLFGRAAKQNLLAGCRRRKAIVVYEYADFELDSPSGF